MTNDNKEQETSKNVIDFETMSSPEDLDKQQNLLKKIQKELKNENKKIDELCPENTENLCMTEECESMHNIVPAYSDHIDEEDIMNINNLNCHENVLGDFAIPETDNSSKFMHLKSKKSKKLKFTEKPANSFDKNSENHKQSTETELSFTEMVQDNFNSNNRGRRMATYFIVGVACVFGISGVIVACVKKIKN